MPFPSRPSPPITQPPTTPTPPYSNHAAAGLPLSTTTSSKPPHQPSKQKPTAPTSRQDPRQDTRRRSVLHPSIAVLLGVNTHWHIPLLICRGLSTLPAAWWGLRCLLTFVGEVMVEGEEGEGGVWSVERRFRVTEVFLALLWCGASAYLSFFFTDCLMSRWLVHYTPQATLVRLLTINSINAYITSWVLYLSGGSEDPRQLLPAWISIASTLTVAYHTTQRHINIRRETRETISIFSLASFASMALLLIQLHLSRVNTMPVPPIFQLLGRAWEVGKKVVRRTGLGPVGREL
ncbi:hypothetical protein VE01_02594 [Pseudogymnoascus verrucosus]|uniref:N-glycosylation protein eos1 n=1 Tax=Pseudogymnoascus verrucosus TaxID=342668 RepID=A0A1B8GTR4_9PEZI|nr:uncharacterized protein VE01_02594 [Pseudogymnoascus verrucosus]OBT99223.2 hypothetical protein VE01_02594 [Pseudogymnoascus verrucosus]